jgi:NAD(P)-dependent dehydrogenase (short-subunit alcohol dehydrogenase family)
MVIGSITESHFDKIFNVNVKGLLFTVQKALPLFQDGGSIILTGSINGFKGYEGSSLYSATKAATDWLENSWTLLTIPQAGHFVQHDAADLVNRTIVNWLTCY